VRRHLATAHRKATGTNVMILDFSAEKMNYFYSNYSNLCKK
jgi:hypothetical protein